MVERPWHEALDTPSALRDTAGRLKLSSSWNDDSRVRKFTELNVPADLPQPWLVDVGSVRGQGAAWFAKGVAEFLRLAAQDPLPGGVPRFKRARVLIALPLVGTGAGGAATIKGDVLEQLMETLLAAPVSVDVALVTRNAAAFAAAQAVRRRLAPSDQWERSPTCEMMRQSSLKMPAPAGL